MHLDVLRSFAAVAQSGSLNKAAERLRVSQSTLTRQMQSLEQEIGGRLFERSHGGVALTAAGQALLDRAMPLLEKLDATIGEVRRIARGQTDSLRIGYIMSAATDYLGPALASCRAIHPEVKVKLVDLSPGEQIAALRRGDIDVALVGNTDASLAREFYVKRITPLPVVVALAAQNPLADRSAVKLTDLRREQFVGAKDEDMPGFNQWVIQLCRRAKFRPRFVENADSLTHALSLVVAENAVTLLPGFANKIPAPGVIFRPLDDAAAKWDLQVAWQRGQMTQPVRALIEALSRTAQASRIRT